MTQRGRASGAIHHGRPTGGGRHGRPTGNLRATLWAVVEPAVKRAGYDLEDLHVSRAGSRSVVRITVDGDQGVGSGAIGDVSRVISAALDEAEASRGELIRGAYVLEVSSPGVDRPLTQPRHWRRNLGRLVKVKIGERPVTGRVTEVDDDGVRLTVGAEVLAAAYSELGSGHVQVEFNRLAEISDDDLAELTDDGDEDDVDEDDSDEDHSDEDDDDEVGDDDEPEGQP